MEGNPPVNPIPNEATVKRYKSIWRVVLIFNFALGGYMFWQSGKKPRGKEKTAVPTEEVAPETPVIVTPPVEPEPVLPTPITSPVIVRQPVTEDQQREIFNWILEEKRKVKPTSREEKKRIDEEKAILKEFIRANSITRI
ncbi:Unknown protein [Striga hermonthica]|uniref:Uncharacterized protein n=1 Tax=Striga hermonthica TaxID=68872 RepID=A0A9N7NB07_STRHE|nr:Unknown protein [Striga hermonthica]